jgi:predicted nucleic acid-binding protein
VPAAFVVDASVLVEFLVPGPWAQAADRFMGGLAWSTPLELFAPDLIFLEVGNALRKLAIRKALSERVAGKLVARLPGLAIATIGASALLEPAWSLWRHMTIYDASYAALARTLRRPVVTTDHRMVKACTAARVPAFRVDDPDLNGILDALEAAAEP